MDIVKVKWKGEVEDPKRGVIGPTWVVTPDGQQLLRKNQMNLVEARQFAKEHNVEFEEVK
jgi:hypothetical protein